MFACELRRSADALLRFPVTKLQGPTPFIVHCVPGVLLFAIVPTRFSRDLPLSDRARRRLRVGSEIVNEGPGSPVALAVIVK